MIESMKAMQAASQALHERYADLEKSAEILTRDPFLLEMFEQMKGKRARYRGRDGEIGYFNISQLSDFHQVLLQSISIEIRASKS